MSKEIISDESAGLHEVNWDSLVTIFMLRQGTAPNISMGDCWRICGEAIGKSAGPDTSNYYFRGFQKIVDLEVPDLPDSLTPELKAKLEKSMQKLFGPYGPFYERGRANLENARVYYILHHDRKEGYTWGLAFVLEKLKTLATFDATAHFLQKKANYDFHLYLETYIELINALKTIPPLEINDPRLPTSVKKEAKSFADMLREIDFTFGRLLSGSRIPVPVEIHLKLFAFICVDTYKCEVAKINDDAYLIWDFIHDPEMERRPFFSEKTCAFRIASDPSYSCKEKAINICPDGFCLFHIKKGNTDIFYDKIGGLMKKFDEEAALRLKERLTEENCDFRGVELLGAYASCLGQNEIKANIDFREANLESVKFNKTIFKGRVLFNHTIFESANFSDCIFENVTSFANARFKGGVSFRNVFFAGDVDFSYSDFRYSAYIRQYNSHFQGADFKGFVSFKGVRGASNIESDSQSLQNRLKQEAVEERLTSFKNYEAETKTNSPMEATNILFEKALPAIPTIVFSEANEWYRQVKSAWASKKLFSGSLQEIKEVVYRNLQFICAHTGFEYFGIEAFKEQNAAQVSAFFKDDSGRVYFVGVRVWRSDDFYFACGNADFQ